MHVPKFSVRPSECQATALLIKAPCHHYSSAYQSTNMHLGRNSSSYIHLKSGHWLDFNDSSDGKCIWNGAAVKTLKQVTEKKQWLASKSATPFDTRDPVHASWKTYFTKPQHPGLWVPRTSTTHKWKPGSASQNSLTRQPTSTVFSWFLWVHLIASFTNCSFQHKKERKFRQPCSLGHCDSLSGRWHGVQKDSGPRSRPRWWSDGGCLPDSGPWSFSTGLSWAAASEEEEAGDVYTGLLSISLHVGETTTEIWITKLD